MPERPVFQNPQIPLTELPGLSTVDWQPLHARYAAQVMLARLGTVAFIAVAMLVFDLLPRVPPILVGPRWGLLAFLGALSVAWPLLAVPRRGYVVRDKDIVYRSGVFWRSVTAVPFNRVQHVETSSTPLDRRFGTATLKVFTAGGSGGDLNVEGLPADIAEQLRVMILAKAGASIERR